MYKEKYKDAFVFERKVYYTHNLFYLSCSSKFILPSVLGVIFIAILTTYFTFSVYMACNIDDPLPPMTQQTTLDVLQLMARSL